MIIETRNNGVFDVTVIVADEGKIFRRKETDELFGNEIWLGYSYWIEGERQSPEHVDLPEDFEEIDIPSGYEVE